MKSVRAVALLLVVRAIDDDDADDDADASDGVAMDADSGISELLLVEFELLPTLLPALLLLLSAGANTVAAVLFESGAARPDDGVMSADERFSRFVVAGARVRRFLINALIEIVVYLPGVLSDECCCADVSWCGGARACCCCCCRDNATDAGDAS